MIESPVFASLIQEPPKFPIFIVLKNHFKEVICAAVFTSLGAVLIALLFLLMPAYLTKILQYPIQYFAWFNAAALLISALLCILFGWIADRWTGQVTAPSYLLGIVAAISLVLLPLYAGQRSPDAE